MFPSIKASLSMVLGILLFSAGSGLRADIKRKFVNNSGRAWTIALVPPPASQRQDPETGNMVFYKAGTTAELARLGEANAKGTFILEPKTAYEVEFTHTNLRYFHYFSLKDARGDGGEVMADYGAAAVMTRGVQGKLAPVQPFTAAVTFNKDSADKELAEKLTINDNTYNGSKQRSYSVDIVNNSRVSKQDVVITVLEANKGWVDRIAKGKSHNLGYVYKLPLVVYSDEDGNLDVKLRLSGAFGSCGFQFAKGTGMTTYDVKIDPTKGKIVKTSSLISIEE